MKKLISRSLFLLAAYAVVMVIDGCNPCGCPRNVKDYFDFSSVFMAAQTIEMVDQEYLFLEIMWDSTEFIAEAPSPCEGNHGLGLGSLYACSCQEPGMEGMKWPISNIEIYSLDDYNDTLPAGTDLAPLFVTLRGVDEIPINQGLLNRVFYEDLELFSRTLPDSNMSSQRMYVDLFKSNGDQVTTDTVVVNF